MDIVNNDHKTKDIYNKKKERARNAAYEEMLHIKPRKEAVDAFKRPAFYKNRKEK